ncbi:MAG: hypothetical protein ACRD0F_08510, partial [Acidimicrobiales bacterium]
MATVTVEWFIPRYGGDEVQARPSVCSAGTATATSRRAVTRGPKSYMRQRCAAASADSVTIARRDGTTVTFAITAQTHFKGINGGRRPVPCGAEAGQQPGHDQH